MAFSLSMVVISVFLHNPLSGYVESNEYEHGYKKVQCTQSQRDELRAAYEAAEKSGVYKDTPNADTKGFIDDMADMCSRDVPYTVKVAVPFRELRSNDPIIPWLGYLINLIQFIVVISVLTGIIFFFTKQSIESKVE
jgi:hypothetical protein